MRNLVFLIVFILSACAPEKKAPVNRAEKIKAQFSGWDGSHINLTKVIKEKMNDPDSYEHIETSFEDKDEYILVMTKFRGNNLYGGKVLNVIFASVSQTGEVIETSDHDIWGERLMSIKRAKEQDEYFKMVDSVMNKKRSKP